MTYAHLKTTEPEQHAKVISNKLADLCGVIYPDRLPK